MSRRPFVRPVSKTGWYFQHPRYLRYMSREISCFFIGLNNIRIIFFICIT